MQESKSREASVTFPILVDNSSTQKLSSLFDSGKRLERNGYNVLFEPEDLYLDIGDTFSNFFISSVNRNVFVYPRI